jgi:V/A-type H+-transporting ATPase subunit D
MELLRLRRRMELARRAKDLLEEKRTVLVMELLNLLRTTRDLEERLEKGLASAYEAWTEARAIMGEKSLSSISTESWDRFSLETATKNIVGTPVPTIKFLKTMELEGAFPYDLATTPAELDKAVVELERVLDLIAEEAEVEAAVKSLATKLESLKRRVNALEYIFLPRIERNIKFIQDHLEEMERESFFRLKRVKSSLERRAREVELATINV